MQNEVKKIGSWLFIIGLVLAVIFGIVYAVNDTTNNTVLQDYQTSIYLVLAVLGFIVGILSFLAMGSITKERIPTFLIATLILVGIGVITQTSFSEINVIGPYFTWISLTLAVFIFPAAVLLAIKAMWDAAKVEETH